MSEKKTIRVSQGCLGAEELAAVKDAFEYGYFGHAHKVEEFEQKLKEYLDAPFVIATNTGTSALHLALAATGIGPGDEVIVPSLTYIASFQAISATGAIPVPCDVSGDNLLLDIEDVKRRITHKTKALMPVHYGGNCCDMKQLMQIKENFKIRIIEDAAHAFGARYNGQRIGSMGDIVCFSFDSIKNITCGEGGAVICRQEDLAKLIREKRMLGIERLPVEGPMPKNSGATFRVMHQGYRYHMSNINAAIGIAQLGKIDSFIERRRTICKQYDDTLKNLKEIKLFKINYEESAPHIYVVRVQNGLRDRLAQYLLDQGIETAIHYVPNHLHPFYRHTAINLPQTEQAYQEVLTLPLHCDLTDDNVKYVSESIHNFLKKQESSL